MEESEIEKHTFLKMIIFEVRNDDEVRYEIHHLSVNEKGSRRSSLLLLW
jgi:hypothetical protein